MRVLSLFDGMSCGRLALDRAGIHVDAYFASEIDKYAIQVSKNNWDDITHVGSVCDWPIWHFNYDIDNIDLIIAGSPCQGFSFAGKQLAFDDPRSKLFFEFINCVKEFKPKYVMLENVKMKKEFQDVITQQLEECGIGTIHKTTINSSLLSAQNRERIYWTNFPVEQPADKGILLRDVLLDGYMEGLVVDENRVVERECDKPGGVVGLINGKDNQANRIRNIDGKTQALAALGGGGGGCKMGMYDLTPLYLSDKAKDYMSRERQPGMPRWEFHKNDVDSKACCLTANMHKGVPYGVIKKYMRRLHPVECERLQTVPDNYTDCVSNTQRYKMLGNGWTVDVIAHILGGIA